MAVSIRTCFGALAPALAAATVIPAGGAAAQERIGAVNYVRVWAYGGAGGNWSDLFTHDAVFAQQGVRTVRDGAAHLGFVDGTARGENRAALISIVEDWAAGFADNEAILDLLERHRVPAAPVPSSVADARRYCAPL